MRIRGEQQAQAVQNYGLETHRTGVKPTAVQRRKTKKCPGANDTKYQFEAPNRNRVQTLPADKVKCCADITRGSHPSQQHRSNKQRVVQKEKASRTREQQTKDKSVEPETSFRKKSIQQPL